MEEIKNTSGQNLGIAALITAILTFVIAVIPCVGLIAIIPGIIAIVLAAVGLSHAQRNNTPSGLPLAGLIIAVIAVMIAFSQVFVAHKIANRAEKDKWSQKIENIVNDVQDNVERGIKDANISIKVESNGDTIRIVSTPEKQSKEKRLEDLEASKGDKVDSVPKKK
jgi:hypothetical protein